MAEVLGPDRRAFLGRTVKALVGTGLASGLLPQAAWALPDDFAQAVQDFSGGRKIRDRRVTVAAPPLVETGGQVLVHITVDSPMTVQNYVRRLLVLVEDNPQSKVALFAFTPDSGVCDLQFRLRMAKSSRIIVLAESSGAKSIWRGQAIVRVVAGACG